MKIAVVVGGGGFAHGGGPVYLGALAAALAERHDVNFVTPEPVDAAEARRCLPAFPHLERIRFIVAEPARRFLPELVAAWRDRRFDAVFLQSVYPPRLTFCRNAFVVCEFPFSPLCSFRNRWRLRNYRGVIANSEYTASWLQRRWGRAATVLHPPVMPIAPAGKRPSILAVGRFLAS